MENLFEDSDFMEQLQKNFERIKVKANDENKSELDVIDEELNKVRTDIDTLINNSIENIKKRKFREKYNILSGLADEFEKIIATSKVIAEKGLALVS
jgi:hypothetical protein